MQLHCGLSATGPLLAKGMQGARSPQQAAGYRYVCYTALPDPLPADRASPHRAQSDTNGITRLITVVAMITAKYRLRPVARAHSRGSTCRTADDMPLLGSCSSDTLSPLSLLATCSPPCIAGQALRSARHPALCSDALWVRQRQAPLELPQSRPQALRSATPGQAAGTTCPTPASRCADGAVCLCCSY